MLHKWAENVNGKNKSLFHRCAGLPLESGTNNHMKDTNIYLLLVIKLSLSFSSGLQASKLEFHAELLKFTETREPVCNRSSKEHLNIKCSSWFWHCVGTPPPLPAHYSGQTGLITFKLHFRELNMTGSRGLLLFKDSLCRSACLSSGQRQGWSGPSGAPTYAGVIWGSCARRHVTIALITNITVSYNFILFTIF